MKRIKNLNQLSKTKLISKRNDVYLISKGNERLVLKYFHNEENYYTEKNFYESINGDGNLKVPNLLASDDSNKVLTIEHISGKTLLEVLECCERKNDKKQAAAYLHKLILWMNKFYDLCRGFNQNWILNDVNLRNFIIHEGEIYGVDFELIKLGIQKDEYVKMLAMYLSYDPINSKFKKEVKKALCPYFYNVIGFKMKELENHLNTETEKIFLRRQAR